MKELKNDMNSAIPNEFAGTDLNAGDKKLSSTVSQEIHASQAFSADGTQKPLKVYQRKSKGIQSSQNAQTVEINEDELHQQKELSKIEEKSIKMENVEEIVKGIQSDNKIKRPDVSKNKIEEEVEEKDSSNENNATKKEIKGKSKKSKYENSIVNKSKITANDNKQSKGQRKKHKNNSIFLIIKMTIA
jgi:hypothetical protein